MQEIKVWDLLVRVLHWGLVVGVVGAWLTRDGEDPRHLQFGYAALAIVALSGDSPAPATRGLLTSFIRRGRRSST